MMIYACVTNNQVVNVITADPDFIEEYEHNYEFVTPAGDGVTIGWTWTETGGFVPPVVVEVPVTPSE